jgi:hypothetical protein
MQHLSSAQSYPHTDIYISEKDPLLPLNGQPAQPPVDCKTRTKLWLKEHVPRAFLYGFIFYFIFGVMQSSYINKDYSRGDVSINEFQLESSDDILAYNHNQVITIDFHIKYSSISNLNLEHCSLPTLLPLLVILSAVANL